MMRPNAPAIIRTLAGSRPTQLINQTDIEWWPAWVLRAKSNNDARQLSQHTWLMRDKYTGQYMHSSNTLGGSCKPLANQHRRCATQASCLTTALNQLNQQLPDHYSDTHQLPWVPEPNTLMLADFDRYKRPLWLLEPAAQAWQNMKHHAKHHGVLLEAISGYRSHAYQLGIIERKLKRGQSLSDVLRVNTAPGYSEHHSGCAVDVSVRGQPACEASFEHTAAHHWLSKHAHVHGFILSYPANNQHGIIHEPWHWCWHPAKND